jgi:hypothetical protein
VRIRDREISNVKTQKGAATAARKAAAVAQRGDDEATLLSARAEANLEAVFSKPPPKPDKSAAPASRQTSGSTRTTSASSAKTPTRTAGSLVTTTAQAALSPTLWRRGRRASQVKKFSRTYRSASVTIDSTLTFCFASGECLLPAENHTSTP